MRYSARIAAVLAVVVAIAGGAVAVALTVHKQPAVSHRPHAAAPLKLTPAQAAAQTAAATAAQANSAAAARWIAAQVRQGLVIGCDPATCAAILAAGYTTGGQVVLKPGVRLPRRGSVIVATAAVRAEYGPRLDSLAPAVIASFGTGAEAVQVAVVVPGGQQAYRKAASKALTARRHAGRKLLADRRVLARGAIRTDLFSGRVDPRLITVLRKLAARYPVHLVHFGDTGPRAGKTIPFRMAEVAVPSVRGRHGRRSDLRGMEKLLRSQPAGNRALLLPKRLAHGIRVLQITFLAPSPV